MVVILVVFFRLNAALILVVVVEQEGGIRAVEIVLPHFPHGLVDEEGAGVADDADDNHPDDGEDDACIEEGHRYDQGPDPQEQVDRGEEGSVLLLHVDFNSIIICIRRYMAHS